MRFLMNENIPGTVIRVLRDRGHDVVAAKETMSGKPGKVILARAQEEKRLLITQDKHFGELAYRAGLSPECGIILFRLEGSNSEDDNNRMLEVIENPTRIGLDIFRSSLRNTFGFARFLRQGEETDGKYK